MEPVFEIDASKQYNQGTSLLVVSDGTYGLFKIKFNKGGVTPEKLNGSYSSAALAKKAVEQYLTLRDSVLNTKERRAAVRAGKEKHAAKQEAKLEEA